MTREGHDHFGVAIPGGGFFLLLFVCFIIHIRVPFFRLKSRERSVQSLRSFPSPSHFKKSPFPSLLFPGKGESGAYQKDVLTALRPLRRIPLVCVAPTRSAERRVGKECVSTCRYGGRRDR